MIFSEQKPNLFAQPSTPVTPLSLSIEFTKILKTMMLAADLDEACRRNAHQANAMVCHTTDFCESRQAMYIAFENFGIDPIDTETGLMSEEHMMLWNAAWSMARNSGFKSPIDVLH